jgi:carboxyl-terminal processing protease
VSERGRGRGPRPLRIAAAFVATVAVAAAALLLLMRRAPAPEPSLAWPDDARREVQALVESRYVDPMTAERADRMFDAAMRGYVGDLDQFSRYFPASERTALDEDMSGTFPGIGIQFDPGPAGLLVTAVRRGGPADRAGLQPGDTIEKVGPVPVTGRERDAVVDMIRGPEGTVVELSVRPAAGGDARQVLATRAKVESDSVTAVRTFDGAPPVGYVRLSQFTENTAPEARDALRGLQGRGAAAIVLDLRRNLGGVVQAAVDVASLFLPPETLVCTARSRDGVKEYRTRVKDGFEPLALPLVVLVDEWSASASEILAGALQDHGRAVLLGTRTYGKFVMQTVVPLTLRGAAVRLTTARYATPHGRSDQKDAAHGSLGGLMPDVLLPLRSRDEDEALSIAFSRECGPAWAVLAGRDAVNDPPDRQLAGALALVRGGDAPAEPVSPRAN